MKKPESTSGLLVVQRIDNTTFDHLDRRPPFDGVSEIEVFDRYRGIDGDVWPGDPAAAGISLKNGLANTSEMPFVRHYLSTIQAGPGCDVVMVARCDALDKTLGYDSRFLGFDIGFLESEFNCYSFLFHEVIYARFDRLGKYGSSLNQNLLLPSYDLASEVIEIQKNLEKEGIEFETTVSPEDLCILAILQPPAADLQI